LDEQIGGGHADRPPVPRLRPVTAVAQGGQRIFRAHFSSLTKKDLCEASACHQIVSVATNTQAQAMQNLKAPDENMSLSVDARWVWRVGRPVAA
jgi:hypothetical protein